MTSESSQDAVLIAEAKNLRQHKGRLEARMLILEDHNRQLESQLQRLRQLLEQVCMVTLFFVSRFFRSYVFVSIVQHPMKFYNITFCRFFWVHGCFIHSNFFVLSTYRPLRLIQDEIN